MGLAAAPAVADDDACVQQWAVLAASVYRNLLGDGMDLDCQMVDRVVAAGRRLSVSVIQFLPVPVAPLLFPPIMVGAPALP